LMHTGTTSCWCWPSGNSTSRGVTWSAISISASAGVALSVHPHQRARGGRAISHVLPHHQHAGWSEAVSLCKRNNICPTNVRSNVPLQSHALQETTVACSSP
jgi:hypothetical protein